MLLLKLSSRAVFCVREHLPDNLGDNTDEAPYHYLIGQRDFLLTLDPATGSAPVTISIPHDAPRRFELAGLVSERSAGVRQQDIAVWPIVRDIVLLQPAHVVRGILPRPVCDYNRAPPPGIRYEQFGNEEPESAYEDLSIARYWQAYHAAIADRLLGAAAQGIRPLLLDCHGFSKPAPYGDFDIIMGTGNRRTISTDVDLKLGKYLTDLRYRVFIPGRHTLIPAVNDYMDADHTVHAANRLGVDAIQLEIARRFRTVAGQQLGHQLAHHIAEFIALYASQQ